MIKKTILITGGAGFIGSHLCQKLTETKDNRVICVDNLITGNKENIKDLFGNPNFSFINQDIVKPLKIQGKIDEIYDLACPASPVQLTRVPIEILLTNSLGVKNVLDLAVEHKAKFLHTSTSEVYGDPEEHPQKESYWGHVNPIGVRSCYDEGKRFAESLIENYRKRYDLDTKIVRIFNTYGPRMRADDGRVVSNFIVQALGQKDLTVYGEGTQTRSFCYVDDMVDGLLKMMKSRGHGPINLGNPQEFTILELAKIILKKIPGSKSKIVFKPLPGDDPTRRCPDISRAKKFLGWKPKVGLEEGLEKTIDYFRHKNELNTQGVIPITP